MDGRRPPWGRRVKVAVVAVMMMLGVGLGGVVARSAFGQDPPQQQSATSTSTESTSTVPTTTTAPTSTTSTTTASTTTVPATTTWVTTTKTMVSGGRTRTYLVVTPSPTPSGKLPVVVVLHGAAVTPQIEEKRTGLLPVVGAAILVYPAGYQKSWNAGNCCGAAHAAGIDDEAFVTAVVAQVLAQHADADPAKVDLVGYSNGGRLAWSLACDDPSLFRAVAVYGAVLDKSCSHLGPISAIEIAGRDDPELAIDASKPPIVSFGFTEPTVTALAAQLRVGDGCGDTTAVSTEGRVTTTTWTNCGGDRRVALALYQGQDHGWPAGGGTTPSAEVVIWQFFASLGAT